MTDLLPIDLRIPPAGSGQLLREIHGQLRGAILDGRLAPGFRLPPTRSFAEAYGVSRNTVAAAYEMLASEGHLEARVGSGNYVAAARARPRQRAAAAPALAARLQPAWRGLAAPAEPAAAPLRADFRLGVPDVSQLDLAVWRQLTGRALRDAVRARKGYLAPEGEEALRGAIAGHVAFSRAVACTPPQVVVTAGAQQAFDLLARLFVQPGKTVVAMEEPGYTPARRAFEAAGARIAPVPVDAEGIRVERIPAGAALVYVTPSHQFPLGCVLSAQRRAQLLALAERRNMLVVEDDYDGEFRFGGRPLDALQTLDRAGRVFYVGTFSKSLSPVLRMGYLVAPEWAVAPLAEAKRLADGFCNPLAQLALAAFIAEGGLARHLRRMQRVYAKRRALLLEGLRDALGAWLLPVPGEAGLHLAAWAVPGFDAQRFVAELRQAGVGVYRAAEYLHGTTGEEALLFGYGDLGEAGIAAGLQAMRELARRQAKPKRMAR
ncbi:MAG: PLP-dependent aminotransferase family protein [Pseudomonadota bacterium]